MSAFSAKNPLTWKVVTVSGRDGGGWWQPNPRTEPVLCGGVTGPWGQNPKAQREAGTLEAPESFDLQIYPRSLGSSCRSASPAARRGGFSGWSAQSSLPTRSNPSPWGFGGLPRPTSSQGAHRRFPFSRNTHLPGVGVGWAQSCTAVCPASLAASGQMPCLPPPGSG